MERTVETVAPLFGSFVKSRRAELELGLREFCEHINFDPSNWSKIERGIFHPPADEATINIIASTLGLNKEQRQTLFDYSDMDRKNIPRDLSEDQYILKMLPAFMRTLRETKPSEDEVDSLLALLREDFKSRTESSEH